MRPADPGRRTDDPTTSQPWANSDAAIIRLLVSSQVAGGVRRRRMTVIATAAATTSTMATIAAIVQPLPPLSEPATAAALEATGGFASVVTGAALVGVVATAPVSWRVGAGCSGSAWPGCCRSIHRDTVPSLYVSRVLNTSSVAVAGSCAMTIENSASVPTGRAWPDTVTLSAALVSAQPAGADPSVTLFGRNPRGQEHLFRLDAAGC
jgi:hypothetical protein